MAYSQCVTQGTLVSMQLRKTKLPPTALNQSRASPHATHVFSNHWKVGLLGPVWGSLGVYW